MTKLNMTDEEIEKAVYAQPLRYENALYLSPCGKRRVAQVVETSRWDRVSTYSCGCKVYENEYGGRKDKCNANSV
jgi:hypothetical protein